ncbi:hypothetical protein GGX14DRAFT_579269 [Mycena pura]|uniref:Uncharacterized protein n=1 Tax=Mycena pura TaxID=153505 RepID=A0AAD6UR32_9AGAR|nr:hypothetical protein GGX14DRAFT_579269 [Mycena pura]
MKPALTTATTAPDPTPVFSKYPSRDEYDYRSGVTRSLVITNIGDPIGLGVKRDGTAKECWDSVEAACAKKSDAGLSLAESELQSIKFTGSSHDDLDALLSNLRNKANTVRMMGGKVEDKDLKNILIHSLPPDPCWLGLQGALFTAADLDDAFALIKTVAISTGMPEHTREPIAKVCSLYLTGHSVEQRQGRYSIFHALPWPALVAPTLFVLQQVADAGAVDEWTPVLSLFVRSTRSEISSTRSVQLPLWRAHTAYPHSPSPRLLSQSSSAYIPRRTHRCRRQHTTIDLPDSRVGPHALLDRAAMRLHVMLMYANAGSRARSVRPERDGHAARCGEVSPTMGLLVTTYEGQPVFFLCFHLTLTYRTKREKARPEEPLLPPRRCFRSSCALSPPSPYEHAAYPESAQDACSLPSCRAASCTRCRTADAQYGPLQLEAALVEGLICFRLVCRETLMLSCFPAQPAHRATHRRAHGAVKLVTACSSSVNAWCMQEIEEFIKDASEKGPLPDLLPDLLYLPRE